MLLTLAACSLTKFDGSRTGNESQLIMECKVFNTTDSQMLELYEGDIVDFAIVSDSGEVDIVLQKEGSEPIYKGKDIPTSSFQVVVLMDVLRNSPSARVVTVASESYRQGGKPILDDIELKDHYSLAKAYGLSKLYVYWVMRHFVGEAEPQGIKNITFNTVEPGSVATDLGRISTQGAVAKAVYFLWKPMMCSVEKGAATSVYMATSTDVEGVTDKFYGNCKEKNIKPKYISPAGEQTVWDYCAKVCAPYMK